jgi:hypothetical protein
MHSAKFWAGNREKSSGSVGLNLSLKLSVTVLYRTQHSVGQVSPWAVLESGSARNLALSQKPLLRETEQQVYSTHRHLWILGSTENKQPKIRSVTWQLSFSSESSPLILRKNKSRGYYSASEIHRPTTAAASKAGADFCGWGCCVVKANKQINKQTKTPWPLVR